MNNKYLKFTAVLIIGFLFTYCNKQKNYSQDYTSNIKSYKNYFFSEPFEVYPEKLYNPNFFAGVINPSALYAEGYSGLYFKSHNSYDFKSIKTSLEGKSIFTGNALDSIHYFVPNFKEINPKGKYPIPNLNDPIYTIKDSLNMANSKILVFKNKEGQFFNKKGEEKVRKFAKLDSTFVVGKGYSNGAIIDYSSKKIIYWVMIW